MRKLIRSHKITGGVLLAFLAAGATMAAVAGGAGAPASRGPNPVAFTHVDVATLAEAGIQLLPATSASRIAAVEAEKVAQAAFSQRDLRETKFVRCIVANEDPAVDRDCWAVSLVPTELFSHGPPGTKIKAASYLLVLVDPVTRVVLLAQAGAPGQR